MILGRYLTDATAMPWGAILAGGQGVRLGGDKPGAQLGGRPLLAWPLAAMRAALDDVAIVAKAGTVLPELPGVEIWTEPDEPSHPLAGIVHGLERAQGRDLVVCAGDLPFVAVDTLRGLAREPVGSLVIAADGAGSQPLLGRYGAGLLPRLRAALSELGPVQALVAQLGARTLAVAPEELFNVNTPEQLAEAQARISRR